MAFNTITSANATFILSVGSIYPGGIPLIGFGVDDAFVAETVDAAETQVGVDGYGVVGYRPREVPMSIRFLASSPSVAIFENWLAYEDAINDAITASGTILLPSVGRLYTMQQGALMRISSMPEARRVLGNREYRINWLPNGPGSPAISYAPF
jgi:hypothetical protein